MTKRRDVEDKTAECKTDGITKVQERIKALRARAMPKRERSQNVVRFERRQGERRATEQPRGGAFLTDKDGRLLFINDEGLRLLGHQQLAAALGDGWREFVNATDRDAIIERWLECVRSRQPFRMQFPMCRADNGKLIMVAVQVMPLLTREGQIVGLAGLLEQAAAQGEEGDRRHDPREAARAISRSALSSDSLRRVASDFS